MDETTVRERLRGLADGVPGPDLEIPRSLALRSRRRMGVTAVAASVVACVVLAGSFVGIRSLALGHTAQPIHPPTPRVSLGIYTSKVYGYSIAFGRSVDPAFKRLAKDEAPFAYSAGVDTLLGDAPAYFKVVIGAEPVPPGTTLTAWTSSTLRNIVHKLGGDRCNPSSRQRIKVDGEPATLMVFARCPFDLHHQWVTVVHGGLAYHIVSITDSGNAAEDLAEFERILSTFTFAGG